MATRVRSLVAICICQHLSNTQDVHSGNKMDLSDFQGSRRSQGASHHNTLAYLWVRKPILITNKKSSVYPQIMVGVL